MDEGNHFSTNSSSSSSSSSPKNIYKFVEIPTLPLLPPSLKVDVVVAPPKPKAVKEQMRKTRVMHVSSTHLHTQERAARRAGFDDLVASKMYSLDLLRKLEQKIQKVIEEEEIKTMRKKMIPRAQLMPVFDRPFLPRRSKKPLTVPEEPRVLSRSTRLNEENVDPYMLFQKSLLLPEMKN